MSIYAVNGKEPIAAWIPSLDSSGNGTTTLTNFVNNTNNGTLTNGPTWQADTGAGGVRAIDFDGVNDRVLMASTVSATVISISCWAKLTSAGFLYFTKNSRASTFYESCVLYASNTSTILCVCSSSGGTQSFVSRSLTMTSWAHIVCTFSQPTISLYGNGSLLGTATHNFALDWGTLPTVLGSANDGSSQLTGRLDDVRVFNQLLDSTDVSYLYNSGNGRGRVTASTNKNQMIMGAGF